MGWHVTVKLFLISSLLFLVVPSGSGAKGAESAPVKGEGAHSPQVLDTMVTSASEAPLDSTAIQRVAEFLMWDILSSRPTVDTPLEADTVRQTIELLDELSRYLPESRWIVGHRVGLRVMLGDRLSALETARDCRSASWWCSMLEGYVLHVMQEFSGADAAFDSALEAMDPVEQCRWIVDTHLLLSGALMRSHSASECLEKIELERRIWWLADPLYLRPGNDRKTEQLARAVAMHLHHEALAVVGEVCTDHHPAEIRAGWEGWEISYLFDAPAGSGGYSFIPSGSAVMRPLESLASDWSLSSPAALESYTPPYGPIYGMDSQVAFFLRGDSAEVVIGTELVGHPLAANRTLEGGLILARSEKDDPLIATGEILGDRFHFRTMAPSEPHLVGIEILSDDEGAARTRFGHGPPLHIPGEIALSDLLLFDWDDELPEELDAIAPRMIGTSHIQRAREVGVFWETYGLGAGGEVEITVVIEARQSRGFLRRLVSAIGLGSRLRPVRIAWTEPVAGQESEVMARALHLGIGHLDPGEYALEITAHGEDGRSTSISRSFELIEQ